MKSIKFIRLEVIYCGKLMRLYTFFWIQIKFFMVVIHLVAGRLGSRLKSLY